MHTTKTLTKLSQIETLAKAVRLSRKAAKAGNLDYAEYDAIHLAQLETIKATINDLIDVAINGLPEVEVEEVEDKVDTAIAA